MVLDISKIVSDKLAQMEADGSIRRFLEEQIEKAVKGAVESAIGGYSLKRAIEEQITAGFPEIVNNIGLSSYNTYIAETVRKVTMAALEGDAQEKIQAAIDGILLKKRDSIRLSEIMAEYRKWVNLNDDEEEKRSLNEGHDGYTCAVREEKGRYGSLGGNFKYYNLYFDEYGDKDGRSFDDYDICVVLSALWIGGKSTVKILDLYFDGMKVSREFVHHSPSSFEALLLNLHFNNTPIIMDVGEIDEDDHYYEVEDY